MIFLDANFIISLFIESEECYETAVGIYEKIKDKNIIISNSIIMEVMTVLNIKLKVPKDKLEEIYDKLNDGSFGIVEDIHLYDQTMKRLLNYYPERMSFFDCMYIELMNQMNIAEIATFDKHFNNKGIKVIKE